ncbi:hypothetical protein GCM10022240_00640 [Microbacterium kribbense]|uniref:ABC3 transporter permease C-terminal domain-containing protein n=1 Tax=Microbacterium kribbense TaxID=433645 RepID=A0ABP7FXZ3_9MICO
MLFAIRRAVRCVGQLVAILAVTAVLGGTLATAAVLADRFIDAGTAGLVAAADPIDRSVVVDGPADTTERAVIDAAIRQAWHGMPLDVVRTTGATVITGGRTLLLRSDAGIAARAALVSGAWPAGDHQVALAAPAAARLGLATGDTVAIGDDRATISGVWRAKDAAATAWAGMPAVASGRQDDAIGPLIGSAGLVDSAGARARWTISAAGPVTAAEVSGYRAGLVRLQASLDGIEGLGDRVTGGWDATLARAGAAAAVARSMLSVPLALVIAVGLLTLGVLGHAAGRRRAADIRLLRARGASRTAVAAETARVVGVVMAVAAALAAGAAAAAGAGPAAAIGIPVVVAAGALVLVAAVAAATSLASPRARGDVGTRSLAAVAGGLALTLVLAVIAVAQLLASGLVHGAGAVDAAPAAAPALALIAAALAAALLAAPGAAIAQRLVRGIRSLVPVLALRRIARQAAVVVAGVLSLSLAAGGVAFAVSTSARAAAMVSAGATRTLGADVRAVYDRSLIADAEHPSLSAESVPGLGAYPVFASDATVGSVPVRLIGLPAERLGPQVGVPAADLEPAHPHPLDGTLDLTVTAVREGGGGWPGGTVTVSAWLVDGDGAARTQQIGVVGADGQEHRLQARVPAGLSLIAVDLSVPAAPAPVSAQVVVGSDGARMPLSIGPRTTRARAMTVTGGSGTVPVVITRALAEQLAVAPDAAVAVRLGTRAHPLRADVVAVRDRLPGVGTGPGVAVDLGEFVAAAADGGGSVPAAGELWADTTDIPAASARLREVATQPVRVLSVASVGTAAVITPVLALTVGGAGVVAVLAVLAFIAVALQVVRARRDEAVPLRAFGFTPARMRAATALELGGAGVFAVAAGVAAGLAIAAWLGPALLSAVAFGGVS